MWWMASFSIYDIEDPHVMLPVGIVKRPSLFWSELVMLLTCWYFPHQSNLSVLQYSSGESLIWLLLHTRRSTLSSPQSAFMLPHICWTYKKNIGLCGGWMHRDITGATDLFHKNLKYLDTLSKDFWLCIGKHVKSHVNSGEVFSIIFQFLTKV